MPAKPRQVPLRDKGQAETSSQCGCQALMGTSGKPTSDFGEQRRGKQEMELYKVLRSHSGFPYKPVIGVNVQMNLKYILTPKDIKCILTQN